jgi:iron complex transport system permease protein
MASSRTFLSRSIVYTLFAVSPILFGLVSLFLGAYGIPPLKVMKILLDSMLMHKSANPQESAIILDVRLPRIMLSCLVGMSLSLSGSVMQGVFRNPLVDPYILGVSAGAAFGCALSTGFLPYLPIQLLAFIFALSSVLLSYSVAKAAKDISPLALVLSGIIVSAIFNALVSLVKFLVDPHKLQSIVYWLMGSFSLADWKEVKILSLSTIPFAILLFLMSWRLNVLSLPEEEAISLGINIKKERLIFLSLATFIVAVAVSSSGIIGWIGLIVPHIVRMSIGPNHRALLPLSMAFGGSFTIFADTVARTISQFDIPVGIITAVLGAPFFVYLLRKGGAKRWESL